MKRSSGFNPRQWESPETPHVDSTDRKDATVRISDGGRLVYVSDKDATVGIPNGDRLVCTSDEDATVCNSNGGRIVFARDLEPILTNLEPTPHGPRLVLESSTFAAILPATPFILELLARKLKGTVIA